jgi:AcrR family transcriptional regulator
MTTARRKGGSPVVGRPTGRDNVVAAVLAAASELFAERGPAATSIRDIAARSGVNHALVFRHFGTKEQLVAAVLEHLSDTVATLVEADPTAPATERAVERNWRVLARAILDGYPVGQLQHQFPYVRGLVERARAYHPDELAARHAAANVIALELGWRLFEPFVRSAAGLRAVPSPRMREFVNAATKTMLEGGSARASQPCTGDR